MWKEIRRAAIVLATCLLAATLLALPAAGKSRLPPEDDGSTFTWPGATTVTVDVEPWGGGYVRSTQPDRLPARLHPSVRRRTRGDVHGVPNPRVHLRVMDRRLRGPAESLHADDLRCRARRGCGVQRPLRAAVVPVSTGSDTQRERHGDLPRMRCEGARDGFHPNSSITLFVAISSPPLGSVELPGFATTDAAGSWSFEGTVPCDFGSGPYIGPFVEDITATDAQGASASGHLMAECVAP